VAYRVVYEADEGRRMVVFVALGVRDEAYRRARNR